SVVRHRSSMASRRWLTLASAYGRRRGASNQKRPTAATSEEAYGCHIRRGLRLPHQKRPTASPMDHVCQACVPRTTTAIRAIIEFCPCSAQSWIISTKYRTLSTSPAAAAIGVREAERETEPDGELAEHDHVRHGLRPRRHDA